MLLLSKLVHVFTGIICLIKGFQSFYVAIHYTGSFQKRTTLYFSSADDNRYHLVITQYSQIDDFRIILLSGGDEQSKYSLWSNPRFTSSQLRDLWRTNDPLLTVVRSLLDLFYFKRMHSWPVWIIQGSKGVQTSHINSLRELLSQHKIVRVKLASDKLDAVMISKNFTSDQNLGPRSELLEVKTKGILFQRKSS